MDFLQTTQLFQVTFYKKHNFSKRLFIIFTIFPMDFLQTTQLFQGTFYYFYNFSKGLFAHYATFPRDFCFF